MNSYVNILRLPDEQKVVIVNAITANRRNQTGFASSQGKIVACALMAFASLIAILVFDNGHGLEAVRLVFIICFAGSACFALFYWSQFQQEFKSNNALIEHARKFGADVSTIDEDWCKTVLWSSIENPEKASGLSDSIKPVW